MPSPTMRSPTMPLRWLYVDFNSYFASVEQQTQPHLRGRPVAVVPVWTESTCAIAVSYEAKAFGVRTGTPVHEAKRLCPDLVCVLARHDAYVDFHHRAMAEIERHIPVSMVCSIDEAACRLMDNEASPAESARIALSIKRGLATRIGEYIRCSIGIAPNRYLAKVATELRKPDGLVILPGEALPGDLLRLAPRDLPGVGRAMERRLEKAGILDMATLWALDAARMRTIWGSVWGERMWHLLRGADLPDPQTQRRSIGHSHVLAPELRGAPAAREVARRLLLKACSRLRRMDYYAGALSFGARLEDGRRLRAEARCWRSRDSLGFLRMLDEIWRETVAPVAPARLKKVSVTLHGLLPAADLPADLLDTPGAGTAPKRGEQLSDAMDRLNHRFGRDTVSLGALPGAARMFSGSKIAFTRIPDRAEFLE